MTKKIKYQGRTYILESSLDKIIKDKLELKIEDTLEDVLGLDNEPEFGTPGLGDEFGGEPSLDGLDGNLDPSLDAPIDENVDSSLGDPTIDNAIEGIKASLGVTDISEETLSHLKMILEDIVSESASVEDVPMSEAPDTILHEGKIFRKVGKLSTSMMESVSSAPKTISVGGRIFKLAGSI